ncbi:MAG TPA: hypothetical protein DF613_12755 [Lachnospiraceae bacterium]|nr:hypothetical protein [Lachnospiraceae bacterium]
MRSDYGRRHNGIYIWIGAFAGVILAVAVLYVWFSVQYSVQDVSVIGNTRYSNDRIISEVQSGLFSDNVLYLSYRKKKYAPADLPLVESIEVRMVDNHSIRITVQETQVVGYVRYLDCDMYFDANGRIVKSEVHGKGEQEEEQSFDSELPGADPVLGKSVTSYVAAMTEVPLITGLSFDRVQLQEILPVKDQKVFNTILGISRMLNKYQIIPEQVEFNEDGEVTLYYREIRILLGTDEETEEKISRAAAILPEISEKSGELHLEDYNGSSENVIFSENKLKRKVPKREETIPEE